MPQMHPDIRDEVEGMLLDIKRELQSRLACIEAQLAKLRAQLPTAQGGATTDGQALPEVQPPLFDRDAPVPDVPEEATAGSAAKPMRHRRVQS